jgi:hypothetical protein
MRRLLAVVLVVLNSLMVASLLSRPADAYNASTFYTREWAVNREVHWGFDSSAQGTDWRNQLRDGFNRWSNLVDGRGPQFVNDLPAGDMGAMNSPCNGPNAVFENPNLSEVRSAIGYTPRCVQDGLMTGFEMQIEPFPELDGTSYPMWISDAAIPANRTDLESLATHEAGHATGWFGHVQEVDQSNCNDPQRPTMCSGQPIGTVFMRSLEPEDFDTIRDAYDDNVQP